MHREVTAHGEASRKDRKKDSKISGNLKHCPQDQSRYSLGGFIHNHFLFVTEPFCGKFILSQLLSIRVTKMGHGRDLFISERQSTTGLTCIYICILLQFYFLQPHFMLYFILQIRTLASQNVQRDYFLTRVFPAVNKESIYWCFMLKGAWLGYLWTFFTRPSGLLCSYLFQ